MKLRHFRLTDPLPRDIGDKMFVQNVVSLDELYRETDQFIEDNFKGACEITSSSPVNAKAVFSINGFSIMLRNIISAAYGKELVEIYIKAEHGYAFIEISTGSVKLDEETANELLTIAEKSGFDTTLEDSRITLSKKLIKLPIANVRARSNHHIYNMLVLWFSI